MEFIAHDSKSGLFLCWTIEVMSWKRNSKYVSLLKRLLGVPVSPNNIQNQYTHASNAVPVCTWRHGGHVGGQEQIKAFLSSGN